MPNGDHDGGGLSGGWWAAIFAGGVALATAIAKMIDSWLPARAAAKVAEAKAKVDTDAADSKSRLEAHTVEFRVYQEMNNALQKRIDHLEERDQLKTKELLTLTREHGKCQAENAEMKGDIRLLRVSIQRLQGITGDEVPQSSVPVIVIADADGLIYVVSPSVAGLLHFLPSELIRKNVETFIPERYKAVHRAGLEKLKQTGIIPNRDAPIIAEALTKDGTEVGVSIRLSAFKTDNDKMMLCVEMIARGSIASTMKTTV